MLVFAMVAHEYAHAVTALQQGDDTAYALGRVTLNPLPHIDPWMSLVLPALLFFGTHGQYTFGGAKPVPVNSRKFRHYRRGDIIVSAAGVTTNLFLSILFAGIFYHALPPRAGAWYRGLGRFGYLPLFVLMFLFQPVLVILLTPARAGLVFLLRLILPYRAGDGWNIFS
jgi:Zn-dependent protease